MTAIQLVTILGASGVGGQSQSYMPFVLLAVPLLLAALLLFVLGRQRRRNRNHEE